MDSSQEPRILPEQSLAAIRQWLSDCLKTYETPTSDNSPKFWLRDEPRDHGWCNGTRHSFTPSRLLDLGHGDLQDDLRLITKEELLRTLGCPIHDYSTRSSITKRQIKFQPPAYATLSHRWGSPKPICTERRTLKDRCSGIRFNSLSRVFREAVLITRQLGIQYLWIDSLCIIQGCKADWEQQSRQMGQVYSSAIINIANNSPIPGESIESVQARLAEEQSKLNDELDTLEFHTGHLEARGWVLQERVLAPATLYYGGEEIRWICRTAEFSASRPTESFEHRGIVLSKMFSHRTCDGNYGLRYISRVLADQDTDRLRDMEWEIMWKWLELVNIYSKRILTDENDRLTALSGCASLFERALGKPYLAGLWLSSIELGLLWEAVQPVKRPSQYLAPSWSWASLLSPVTNYQKRDINEESSHFLVEILGHNVSVSSNNPYGAVSSEPRSWLRLHGKVFEGRLRFKREEWGEFVYFDVQDHPDDHKVAPDYPLPSMADFGTVWLLPVAWMGSWYASLVLVELGLTESRVFRRIGFCDCHSIEKAMWDSVIKESFLLV